MALATASTDGDVFLVGDLAGTATSPTLSPTGVTAGSYKIADMVIDSKGRIVYGTNTSAALIRLSLPTASTSVIGLMQVGAGLSISTATLSVNYSNVTLNLTDATTSTKGVVQIGTNISVTSGTISVATATTGVKGIVQVGTNIDVSSGVISIATATTGVKGVVQVGTNIDVTSGTISVATATTGVKGIVQVGTNIGVSSGTISVATGSNATVGVVNSANTSNITITSGGLNTGANVPLINANNTFTKAQNVPIQTTTSNLTPDLTSYNVFDIRGSSVITISNPTGSVSGSEFSVIGDFNPGATSTGVGMPSSQNWKDVAWNGTVFCAIANTTGGAATTVAATSTTGLTFTSRTISTSQVWIAIAWNGSVFCAVSNSATGATSPDGVTWTTRTLPHSGYSAICAGNGKFCALRYDGSIATSTDGISWSSSSTPTVPNGTSYKTIAWNGSVFCALGGIQVGTLPTCATSPDGTTWTDRTPPARSYSSIAWNGKVFCAVSDLGEAPATSPDGVTWTSGTMSTNVWSKVCSFNGMFVAIRNDGASPGTSLGVKSADGLTWTALGNFTGGVGTSANYNAITANSTTLVALSYGSSVETAFTDITYGSNYKFSNYRQIGAIGDVWKMDCVVSGSTIYCTYF